MDEDIPIPVRLPPVDSVSLDDWDVVLVIPDVADEFLVAVDGLSFLSFKI